MEYTKQRIEEENPLDDLSVLQRAKVWEMLTRCRLCLSTGSKDIGQASVTAHKISLYDKTPIYQRPRRFPEPVNIEIERQCEELYDIDVIEPSSSAWSSPVVPVRKADGSLRLCIDYRRLNHVTKPERIPIPTLSESIYNIHGMKYFTSLDLIRGYYQIPITDDSKEYTAFSTARAHWQFRRLSFGLRNAPGAFQREIQTVLKEFPWKKVVVYIDDILIMEETFEKQLLLVEKVLQTLCNHGIKIKPDKCQWFAEEVSFLGHSISADGLKKQQVYIDKVDSFPRPNTVTQLQEFLGLVNFQRKFVEHASTIQKPLSELTGGKGTTKIE